MHAPKDPSPHRPDPDLFAHAAVETGPSGLRRMRRLLHALLLGVAGAGVGNMLRAVRAGEELSRRSVRFQHRNPGASLRILVAGDSSAVGVGAQSPQYTVAGYFGADLPAAEIINFGRTGARVQDVRRILDDIGDTRFFLCLLQMGGNDILRWTSLRRLRSEACIALARAKVLARRVAVVTGGDIGRCPVFPAPLGVLLSERARKVRSVLQQACTDHEACFVDMMASPAQAAAVRDPRNCAADGLHPNGEGYRLWYDAIRAALSERYGQDGLWYPQSSSK